MTFAEKKKLYDQLNNPPSGLVSPPRYKEILAKLNYPKVVTEGNAHADVILAAWSEYWEGNPPHPNWGWQGLPDHLK